MGQTSGRAPTGALTQAERRHLLRRLAFATTPALEHAIEGLPAEAALGVLLGRARETPMPMPPAVAQGRWTNRALRYAGMSGRHIEGIEGRHRRLSQTEVESLRQWWIQELVSSPAPLRENLVLFLHGVFGSSTGAVDAPHALLGRNTLYRRRCLGTLPDLLAALVIDPAMLMQIGMDEHQRLRVSDRPAKLILDHWTVGEGRYDPLDLDALSRALTGWLLVAPEGTAPTQSIDPRAPRAARRTGLVPTFNPAQFDAGEKTILGRTATFDARAAVRWLAEHDATAHRFSRLLLAHLGVEDDGPLEAQLASVYRDTRGSIEALVRAVITSDAFWSETSRWTLIKSPVHLAVGACRQLGVASPPVGALSRWLRASGQVLFDTPNDGEGGWPGHEAWVTPPAKLTVRYHLAAAMADRLPPFGLDAPVSPSESERALLVPVAPALRGQSAADLFDRLDPAPGLEVAELEPAVGTVTSAEGRSRFIHRVIQTPEYQLA